MKVHEFMKKHDLSYDVLQSFIAHCEWTDVRENYTIDLGFYVDHEEELAFVLTMWRTHSKWNNEQLPEEVIIEGFSKYLAKWSEERVEELWDECDRGWQEEGPSLLGEEDIPF